MAYQATTICSLFLIAVAAAAATRPPPPAAAKYCIDTLQLFDPCLPFFEDGSMASAPPHCCDGISKILSSPNAACFCHIMPEESYGKAIGVPLPFDRCARLTFDYCDQKVDDAFFKCDSPAEIPPIYPPCTHSSDELLD